MQLQEIDYLSNKESMDGHPTVAFKPVYKSFKFKNSEAMKGLKGDKKTSLRDNSLFISNLRSQDSVVVQNPQPDESWNVNVLRNSSRESGYEGWQDSVDGKGHIAAQYSCSDSEENERKNHATRKAAMDYDLPELVVFLQESNYQFVKDICIDWEASSHQDKCLVENWELDHDSISCLLNSDVESNSESAAETPDSVSSNSSELKPITEHDCKKDVSKQLGSKNLTVEGEKYVKARNGILVDHSTKKTISETLLLVRQDPNKVVLANSMATDDNSRTRKASVKSDLKNASIAYYFETANGRVEVPQSCIPDSPEDRMSDSLTGSSQTRQHSRGESSSSASELPHSGPLAYAYLGAIPSFRSFSLRSSSSTTSSQSFAFPMLSSEWNGSPVRMVKADQTQFRRHRQHWGIRFLCCKF